MEGIVSKETQLGVLSIVDNANGEIEKMNSEQNKTDDDAVMKRMFGAGGNKEITIGSFDQKDRGTQIAEMLIALKEIAEKNGIEPVDFIGDIFDKMENINEQ